LSRYTVTLLHHVKAERVKSSLDNNNMLKGCYGSSTYVPCEISYKKQPQIYIEPLLISSIQLYMTIIAFTDVIKILILGGGQIKHEPKKIDHSRIKNILKFNIKEIKFK
jgi:hypothetical protein